MVTILIPTNICLIASRHASFKMYKKININNDSKFQ